MHHTDAFKSQLFISTIAWIFIILSATVLYFSITNVVVFKLGMDLQKEMFADMGSGTENGLPQKMQEIWQTMWLFLLVGLLSSVALLISAVNLLKRRNWARILFTVVCVLIAMLFVALAFYMKYQAGEMLDLFDASFGDASFSKIKLAQKIQLASYLIFMVFAAWAVIRVLVKLNSQRMREYFY